MNFPPLLVVIHETIISAASSFRLHADPQYIASYHVVIERNGNITYLVPSEHKAFGAATSGFQNPLTDELEEINGSVDDFAYHIALETPPDGLDPTLKSHSGYTIQQYESLAWLVKATGVYPQRVVTHGEIQTPTTTEPRCFNLDFMFDLYRNKTNNSTLNFGILKTDNGIRENN